MTNLLKKALLLATLAYAQMTAAQSYSAGLEAMQLEEWDNAISAFSAVVKANPADQSALLSLGNAYLAKGDKEKAMANFKAAFDAKADGPLAFVALGRQGLLQGNSAEADKQFDRAKRSAKKDMTVWRHRAESYIFYIEPGAKKPNLTRAVNFFKEGADVSGKDFDFNMSYGYCYREMSEGGPAAQQYELAESVQPQNPLPKLMLAKVYRIGKLPEKALMFYDKAVQVAPKYTPALRGKAEYLYFTLRKWEDATKAYKQLVEQGDAVKIEDEMQLANCYYITKDCKSCSDLVEKILAKDPSKNYLRRLQAYCDYENGQYERALKTLNEYFKIVTPDKELASDYEYRAKLLVQTKGDTTQAIADYRKVIAMDSSKWALYAEMDKLEWGRRNYCSALEAYKQYLDSVPTPKATEWYTLGQRHYFCKDDPMRYENAEKAFVKVTEMNPDAGIGWLWAGKSAAKRDPLPDSIAVHPELANQYGMARDFYERYSAVAEKDKEKNKKDLLGVYNYLAYCYFVRNEAEKFNPMVEKWLALETDESKKTTIVEMRDAFGKDPASTPDGGGKNK